MCYVNCEVIDLKIKRVLGAVCALALMLCANMRCVYTVEAGGEELPGLWSRAEIEAASAAAIAAAEEVARAESALPELNLRARLSFSPVSASETGGGELAAGILRHCRGVDGAWRVLVDGAELGTTDDRSVLGELLDGLMASRVSREAVDARLDGEISFVPVCIPEGRATESALLAEAICDAAPVIYTTPDGEEHLAFA